MLHCALALSIDLFKAFDRVDHHAAVNILVKTGISLKIASWLHSYLSECMQFVKSGNVVPDAVVLEKGNLLLLLLLSVMILDMSNVKKVCDQMMHSVYHLYTDDAVLYSFASSFETAEPLHSLT